jgi:hypothetical protein
MDTYIPVYTVVVGTGHISSHFDRTEAIVAANRIATEYHCDATVQVITTGGRSVCYHASAQLETN